MRLTNLGVIPSNKPWLSGYDYVKEIIIPANSIDEELTNFPCTVYLDDTNFDFSKAKSDGSDIRFTDSRLNQLKFERVEHIPANGKAVYTVQIPTVSSIKDTKFYMWYGNSNAYNTSIESWQDQTGKPLTYYGNVKLAPNVAKFGRCAYFDGSGGYFDTNTAIPSLGTSDFAIEIRLNPRIVDSKYRRILSTTSGAFTATTLLLRLTNINKFYVANGSGTGLESNTTILANTEYEIKISKTGGYLYLYINNVLEASTTDTTTYSDPLRYIGGYYTAGNGEYFDGSIYGVRVTKGRSRDGETVPDNFEIDGSDVVFCTNFDTIYDSNYLMVQHMGDSLIDATGNGENLTNYNTSIIDTYFGKSRVFNGSSSYLRRSTSTFNRSGSQEITVSAFIQPNWISGYQDIVVNRSASLYNWMMYMHTTDGSVQFHGASQNKSTYIPTNGKWSLICAKVNSSNLYTLHADESLKQSVSGYTYSASAPSELSVGNFGTAEYFNGIINSIRISNIARSDAWIKAESLVLKDNILTIEDLNIVTDGLILHLDASDIENFSVEPTTNLMPSPTTEKTGANEYLAYADTTAIFDSNGVGTYTFSFDVKAAVAGSFICYCSDTTSEYIKYKFTDQSFDATTEFQRFYMTTDVYLNSATATTGRICFYAGYGTGVILTVKNVQIEKKDHATPFVVGYRSAVWYDLSGNSHNGTLVNGVSYNANNNGYLIFDGSNDYIQLPNDLGYTNAFTACAWFKSLGTPAGGYHIIFGGQELEISIPTSGSLRVGLYTSSRFVFVNDYGSGLTNGDWHHVCMTFDGTKKKGYIDGILVGEASVTGTLMNSFNRTIGRYGTSTVYYANGFISNAKIYNRALTATEVLQNYKALRRRYI